MVWKLSGSCKVCRKTFHKILCLAFHCFEEDHERRGEKEDRGDINPSWTRSNLDAISSLRRKLKVQNEAELDEIKDLEDDDWRQKRLLPERRVAAKKMKKYNLVVVVVVRTVPEEIIHNLDDISTETDTSDSEDIEVIFVGANKTFCPPSSSPTMIKKTRQELPRQRLGTMDKVAAWLDTAGDGLERNSSTSTMSLSPLPDLAYTVTYGATVRKKWKKLVVAGSFIPSQYPGVQRCKVAGCQGEFEDGLEAFMHIRDTNLMPNK